MMDTRSPKRVAREEVRTPPRLYDDVMKLVLDFLGPLDLYNFSLTCLDYSKVVTRERLERISGCKENGRLNVFTLQCKVLECCCICGRRYRGVVRQNFFYAHQNCVDDAVHMRSMNLLFDGRSLYRKDQNQNEKHHLQLTARCFTSCTAFVPPMQDYDQLRKCMFGASLDNSLNSLKASYEMIQDLLRLEVLREQSESVVGKKTFKFRASRRSVKAFILNEFTDFVKIQTNHSDNCGLLKQVIEKIEKMEVFIQSHFARDFDVCEQVGERVLKWTDFFTSYTSLSRAYSSRWFKDWPASFVEYADEEMKRYYELLGKRILWKFARSLVSNSMGGVFHDEGACMRHLKKCFPERKTGGDIIHLHAEVNKYFAWLSPLRYELKSMMFPEPLPYHSRDWEKILDLALFFASISSVSSRNAPEAIQRRGTAFVEAIGEASRPWGLLFGVALRQTNIAEMDEIDDMECCLRKLLDCSPYNSNSGQYYSRKLFRCLQCNRMRISPYSLYCDLSVCKEIKII